MESRIPAAYMPPYLIKGYLSYPKTDPLIIPQDLRKSMDMERRKSLGGGKAAVEASPLIHWPSIKYALERHRCPTHFPEYPQSIQKVTCPSRPPPGYSNYYWRLKLQGYARKPDQTVRRRAKFSVLEKRVEVGLRKRTFPPFEGYITPMDEWACSLPPCPMPGYFKEQEVKRRVDKVQHDLDSLNLDYAKVLARIAQAEPYVPLDRVNTGCERLRKLAKIDAEAVYLLVKKFVTGPPDKDFSFLKRSEVAECWERIVTLRGKKVKDCCVQQLVPDRTIPDIPALTPRPICGQKIVKCGRKRGMEKSGPRVPPFNRPIPVNPKLRLPWQLTPFKGRNETPLKSKVYALRELNLDDIITQFDDRYGELRLRQKEEKVRSLRTAMLRDFLDRTDVSNSAGYPQTRQLKMEQLNISAEERKEMLLASILRHEQSENSVERVVLREQVKAREARIRARAETVDYSQIPSKYMEKGRKRARGFIQFTN